MTSYVDYWKSILKDLKKPIPSQSATLTEGLWLAKNWRRCHVVVGIDTVVGDKHDTQGQGRD